MSEDQTLEKRAHRALRGEEPWEPIMGRIHAFVRGDLDAEIAALRAELQRKDAALKEARDWRGDLTALYEKRDAICRGMKDCKHCAKWAGHPISTMCCESGTPNHYGQLSNIDKEIRREEDRCIVPHEVRAIIERALQPKEPPCKA